MRRIVLSIPLLLALAAGTGRAQVGGITAFPYTQQFGFVTAATTMFPSGNIDGGELSADAGTPTLWTTSAAGHGLNNNGGAGGAIRLQSTAGAGAAGFVWHGSMPCHSADSLAIRWTKSTNGAASTRTNELRVATNDGAGATFTDIPLVNIAGGGWPAFDNAAGAQSGWLRVALPSSLDGSRDVRIRIYSTNRSGSGNHPRVIVDSLSITAGGAGLDHATVLDPPRIDGNAPDTLRIDWTRLAGAAGYLVLGRQDSTPADRPSDGRVYRAGAPIGRSSALAVTSDTLATIVGLARNSAWFIRVVPFRDCDTTYGAASMTLAVVTPDTGAARRFAIRAGRLDTIGHDGVTIRFTVAPAADGSILIARRRNPGNDGLPMHRNGKPPIDRLAGSWWDLSPRGLDRFTADLSFDIADIPGVGHPEDLEIVSRYRENLQWGDIIPTAFASDSSGRRLVSRGQSSFGNYAIGAAGGANVLPVTLASFEGVAGRGGSLLSWRTESETQSAGFILSRAEMTGGGCGPFLELATVAAKGKPGNAARYDYIDRNDLRPNIDYIYRLQEQSLSGEITELARLPLQTGSGISLRPTGPSLRPNPVSAGRVMLELPSDIVIYLRVDIHTIDGVPIRTPVDRKTEPGEGSLAIDLAGLPAGFYLCRIAIGERIVALPLTVLP